MIIVVEFAASVSQYVVFVKSPIESLSVLQSLVLLWWVLMSDGYIAYVRPQSILFVPCILVTLWLIERVNDWLTCVQHSITRLLWSTSVYGIPDSPSYAAFPRVASWLKLICIRGTVGLPKNLNRQAYSEFRVSVRFAELRGIPARNFLIEIDMYTWYRRRPQKI